MKKNLIITATNSPYFDSLLTLISSIHEHSLNIVDEILIFDLGLTNDELEKLKTIQKVRVVNFTIGEKNSHPHFMSPKWHVYKLTCLKNSLLIGNNVLWLDSGVCALKSLDVIFDKIENDDIFLVADTHLTKTYTHTNCQKIMSATEDELNQKILSSGIFGFKSDGKYSKIIDEAYEFSLIPGCCDGDQENHRHDQSILSILSSRYKCPTNDIEIYGYWTDLNRNIHTAKENGVVIFVHRRGHNDKTKIMYNKMEPTTSVTPIKDSTFLESIGITETTPKLKIKLVDENLTGQDGLSRYISPNSSWIRDINSEDYDIAIFTDTKCFHSQINTDKINFAWLIEPPVINGENYKNIVDYSKKFNKVFSHNLELSNKIDNFIYVPHGGTWLRNEDIGLHNKTNNISFIYSDKQWNLGHRLRHNFSNYLIEKEINVDFYGSGPNNRIEFKTTALKEYRFSIVIENSIVDSYFTEKIIDCFLSGVIPIYWGTSKIVDYFDSEGIILMPNSNEHGFDMDKAIELINGLNEDYYKSKIVNVMNNFNIAQNYSHPEILINNYINFNF